jgi:hypothetical protein
MANVTIVMIKDADHRTEPSKPDFIKSLRGFLGDHHGQ